MFKNYVISQKLDQAGLNSHYLFKNLQFSTNLKDFIQSQYPILLQSTNIIQLNKTILEKLSDLGRSKLQKIWIQLLFIDSLIQFYSKKLIQQNDFIQFLQQRTQRFNQELSVYFKQVQKRLHKRRSTGYLFVKSFIVNTDLVQLERQQPLFKHVVNQYLLYIRKKLMNINFYHQLKQIQASLQQKYYYFLPIQKVSQQQAIKLKQNVWRIVNFMKNHKNITHEYKQYACNVTKYLPLMIATLNLLIYDNFKLYPYVVQFIEINIKSIIQKYDQIQNNKKISKDTKKFKFLQLRQDQNYKELQNLLKQLAQINQNILFIFCGASHADMLKFKLPKRFFLGINSSRLDKIYQIINQIRQLSQKKKKSKNHMSLINIHLNSSLNSSQIQRQKRQKTGLKIIQKIDQSDFQQTSITLQQKAQKV